VGIIIISARTDLNDKVTGYESGADWYITKPVVFAELTAAIRRLVCRRLFSSVASRALMQPAAAHIHLLPQTDICRLTDICPVKAWRFIE
jgi:DNA-binding response OmpR family regulator